MRIAVPTLGQKFSLHFGKCDGLYLCEADPHHGTITSPRLISRAEHGCESMPRWLASLAVDCVVAGGMGGGAQQRLTDLGVRVSLGHAARSPEDVVRHFLADPDAQLPNACGDHEHEHHHCGRQRA